MYLSIIISICVLYFSICIYILVYAICIDISIYIIINTSIYIVDTPFCPGYFPFLCVFGPQAHFVLRSFWASGPFLPVSIIFLIILLFNFIFLIFVFGPKFSKPICFVLKPIQPISHLIRPITKPISLNSIA